jgi:hypothetical protein
MFRFFPSAKRSLDSLLNFDNRSGRERTSFLPSSVPLARSPERGGPVAGELLFRQRFLRISRPATILRRPHSRTEFSVTTALIRNRIQLSRHSLSPLLLLLHQARRCSTLPEIVKWTLRDFRYKLSVLPKPMGRKLAATHARAHRECVSRT